MSARGFGSVLSVGAVAGAALGFYLVSLRVASERAALEQVETEIALAQRDIRLLQTEIGARGRLTQLERWNVKFIRLSAPTADQFVDGGFQLASLAKPEAKPAIDAPVILAAAPVGQSDRPKLARESVEPEAVPGPSRSPSEMMHVASFSVPERATTTRPAVVRPTPARPLPPKANGVAVKPLRTAPATKPVKTATADPLAPLSAEKPKAKGTASAASAGGLNPKRQFKDSDD